ncbi:tensin-1-like [Dendropsophus ebraccatus]|uniref:tensin-1-like n=1 Tax=Dendropsophus ebraccatus TaxID=150705 RepID=UPI003831F09C
MGCTVSFICCEEDPIYMSVDPKDEHPSMEETTRLLPKPEDLEGQTCHTFKIKNFKKVKSCSVCKQAITREGSACRVCRLSCHRKCEAKHKSQRSPCLLVT